MLPSAANGFGLHRFPSTEDALISALAASSLASARVAPHVIASGTFAKGTIMAFGDSASDIIA